MTGRTLRTMALLVGTLGVAPLAVAQDVIQDKMLHEVPSGFIATMAGLGMLFVVAIVAVVHIIQYFQKRQRLQTIERLLANGQSVPRELLSDEPPRLPLAEQRRRDVRRGITMLCWALGISLVFYLTSGGQPRAAAWGLLLLFASIGNFVRAWLITRELAAEAKNSQSPQ